MRKLSFALLAFVPLTCLGVESISGCSNPAVVKDTTTLVKDACVLLVDLQANSTVTELCSKAEPIWPLVESVVKTKVGGPTELRYVVVDGGRAVMLSEEEAAELRSKIAR